MCRLREFLPIPLPLCLERQSDCWVSEFPVELLEASITGVKEAFANITEAGGIDPVVKATIRLSPSGFVSVPEAWAYAELKDDSIAGTHPSLPSPYPQ